MRRLFRLAKNIAFHPDPKKRIIITLWYCGLGIFVNFFCLQVFCMPVWWAAALCILFFFAIVSMSFITNDHLKMVLYFLLGIGVPIAVYCIIFLADPFENHCNYVFFTSAILFFGAGLLAFIPFYLLWHICKYYMAAGKKYRRIIKFGIFLPVFILIFYLVNFRMYINNVKKLGASATTTDELVKELPANYFTERMLGLHWKYHTRLEFVYDGWRPPLNDPFLVIALWTVVWPNFRDLKKWPVYNWEAIKYYHRKFPDNPLHINCPCSFSPDGRGYIHAILDSAPPQYFYTTDTSK